MSVGVQGTFAINEGLTALSGQEAFQLISNLGFFSFGEVLNLEVLVEDF